MQPREYTTYQYKLYNSELQSILTQVIKDKLTFEEMYLICFQSNIKLFNSQVEKKLKQIFKENMGSIPIRECFNLLQLKNCQIIHNRPVFYVSIALKTHMTNKCINDWKNLMFVKYGNHMKWFDAIADENKCLRLKSYQFKQKLKNILVGTPHENCIDAISHKFPKNCKNEIELKTFMEVIRHMENKNSKIGVVENSNQISKQNTHEYSHQKHCSEYVDQTSSVTIHPKIEKTEGSLALFLNQMKQKLKLGQMKQKQYQRYHKTSLCQYDKFLSMSCSQINKKHEQIIKKFRGGQTSDHIRRHQVNYIRFIDEKKTSECSTNTHIQSKKSTRPPTTILYKAYTPNSCTRMIKTHSSEKKQKFHTEPSSQFLTY